MTRLLLLALLVCPALSWAEPSVDLVRVFKAERKLQLVSNGRVLREFKVALGGDPKGPKQQEGDGKTPEGIYTLDFKKADSGYHHSFHISYPNRADLAAARARGVKPGGSVMIHGQKNGLGWLSIISQRLDWTKGCIALDNADMDVVWAMVGAGTKIEIKP